MIQVIGILTCPAYREDRHQSGRVSDGRKTKIGTTRQVGDACGCAILSSCVHATIGFDTSDLASDRGRECQILVIINLALCLQQNGNCDDFAACHGLMRHSSTK